LDNGLNHFLEEYAQSKTGGIEKLFNELEVGFEDIIFEYAVWDDMYNAIENKDKVWIKENITDYIYQEGRYGIDFIYIYDRDQELVDYYGDQRVQKYINGLDYGMTFTEYALIDDKMYLISASPITDNNYLKENGYFVLGRMIDEEFLSNALERSFSEDFRYMMPAEALDDTSELLYKTKHLRNTDEIFIRKVFYDIEKNIIGNYEVFFRFGAYTSQTRTLFTILHMAILLTSFVFLISLIVILIKANKSLESIIRQIDRVARGDYSHKITHYGSKEMQTLSNHVNILSDEVQKKISEIEVANLDAISTLVNAIEAKDKYTKGHSERVKNIALILSQGYKEVDKDIVSSAAILHDIGKISIHEDILNKPGKLTDDEYELIKTHPQMGYDILRNSRMLNEVKEIVLQHHERPDGKGYPNGLKGDQMSMYSKILQVADTFDAINSDRPYRKGRSFDETVQIIIEEQGAQFDEDVVDTLLVYLEDIREYLEVYKLENKK